MSIDTKQIQHLAHLARLALSDEEALIYSEKLNQVLNYVSRIEAVPTDRVQPMSHPIPIELHVQTLRLDAVNTVETTMPDPTEFVLSQAPQAQEHLFLVPAVL